MTKTQPTPIATPPTEQATEGGVTTERDVRCHVPAVAQGETPHEVACRLLNESDPNNVDKWREVNAVEAIITPLVKELNEAKAERDQARQDLEERCAENDRERAAHLQAYQAVTRERDEARQWLAERPSTELYDRAVARNVELCHRLAAVEFEFAADHNQLEIERLAAESELAELRKDRETLKRLRTMAKNADNISLGASIRHADAARNQQEGRG